MKDLKKNLFIFGSCMVQSSLVLLVLGCAGTSGVSGGGTTTGNPVTTEDSSTSGAAAEAVGGALSGSQSGGTLAFNSNHLLIQHAGPLFWQSLQSHLLPEANAAGNTCPTYRTVAGATCTVSGSSMLLSYNDCKFTGAAATWSGVLAMTPSSGTPSCGTFPNPGASGTLYRQYVTSTSSNTPASATVTTRFGTVMTIDDQTANLDNFDNVSISTVHNSGYGTSVSFNGSGARTAVVIGHHISTSGGVDHSVTGNLAITETAGDSSRQINGTLTVYHNQLRVIGSSQFNQVVHSDLCCLPISGSITTTFTRGTTNPTVLGALAVGKSETLTFTGCGTATLTSYDGSSSNVELSKCY